MYVSGELSKLHDNNSSSTPSTTANATDYYSQQTPQLTDDRRASALYYLYQAAECGDCKACYCLGRLHESFQVDDLPGLVLHEDELNALHAGRFYKSAADSGLLEACVRMAKGYENGDLVQHKDVGKAFAYWKLADEYVCERDAVKDAVKEFGAVARYSTLAAMARLYQFGGNGFDVNFKESYRLYSEAAECAMVVFQSKVGTEFLMLAEEVGCLIEGDDE